MAALASQRLNLGAATPLRAPRAPIHVSACLRSAAGSKVAKSAGLGVAQLGTAASRPAGTQRQAIKVSAFWRREPPAPLDPNSPEQVALRSSAGWQKSLSFVAFWLQLALTIVSAGVLVFSLMVSNVAATNVPAWPRYFTAAGIVAAFLSTFFAHGFLRLARNLSAGEAVNPGWLGANLLRCNALNVAGIALTVVGLQASVGTLVAKSLMTSVQGAFAANAANALVSIDVFSLQAATNTVLSHVVSLIFTNMMLGVVGGARNAAGGATANGVELGADGMSPVRPSTLGYSPWNLKAD
ncbi:hypothetical protein CHLRE_11g467759v5 [Chlamydomonas reinhardtii]|uniref:Uncharacterized protein n=1 Tax=Chlamydomonas reinhardtii TaxID=3055 RepID=A0A2K3D7X5_CHLRE|nr:uncharacterized protein CHLRE_11g467759v5 [Chlamydomonas reinhardtii]PNW76638.1 hypothetical protein CHLRE_11g467759v5 [Chlamydomonas reinhardtii]